MFFRLVLWLFLKLNYYNHKPTDMNIPENCKLRSTRTITIELKEYETEGACSDLFDYEELKITMDNGSVIYNSLMTRSVARKTTTPAEFLVDRLRTSGIGISTIRQPLRKSLE